MSSLKQVFPEVNPTLKEKCPAPLRKQPGTFTHYADQKYRKAPPAQQAFCRPSPRQVQPTNSNLDVAWTLRDRASSDRGFVAMAQG
jgi:hypothetical protein